MKRNYTLLFLLGLLILFMAVACKSAPPPEEEIAPTETVTSPEDPPPDQAALNTMNAAAERAAAARKLVTDFDGPDLFPPEWQSADSLYSQATQQKKSGTARETRESTDRFNRAADALEALAAKTLAAQYENMSRELTAARNNAVNAGAQTLIPDLLLDADNTTALADGKFQVNNYYGAKDSAEEALSMYVALKTGLDAYKVREEIFARGFDIYDPISIELSDADLYEAADYYYNKEIPAAQEKTESAMLRYALALKTGWESYAAEKGAFASAERQKALDLRANVAVRQEFNSAQSIFTRANTAFQRESYEEAANLFEDSESMFEVIAQVALEKQRLAEQALNRASQKMTESDETAKNAEVILEGGI